MGRLLRIALVGTLLALTVVAAGAQAQGFLSIGFCITGVCEGTGPVAYPSDVPEKPGCQNIVGRGGLVDPWSLGVDVPGEPVIQVCA